MSFILTWLETETRTAAEGGDTVEQRWSTLELEGDITETHTLAATATEHPVELGVSVSDHVRPSLDRLTLEAIVSNHPISRIGDATDQGLRSGAAAGEAMDADLLLPTTPRMSRGAQQSQRSTWIETLAVQGVRVLQFPGAFDRPREVLAQLADLRDRAVIVSIDTSLRTYEDLVIVGITVPRDAKSAHTLKVTIDLQQIRQVETLQVDAVAPRVERARPRADQGSQPTETQPATAPTAQAASIAAQLMDEAGRIVRRLTGS